MIKTTDAGKACDKIQHPFMIQILSKLATEWNFLHLIKEHLQQSMANINT